MQRKTQTAAFWRDQFELTQDDLDFIHDLVLDADSPLTTDQLSLRLVEEYQRRETRRMESELAKGKIYQPDKSYEVGQTLVFPAMDFAVAEVVATRPGENPEHGDFSVIQLQFADGGAKREFAAGLQTPHRLNQLNGQSIVGENDLLSSDEIYGLYKDEIEESVLYALEEGDRHEEFVQVSDFWLLSDMLADIHVGHLNIAEAMIEMQGRPLSSQEILQEIDINPDISEAMQVISIDHAMSADDRFDLVGQGTAHLWFLKRLEPQEALEIPPLLRVHAPRYNRALLSVELLQIEWELDDEWGESGISNDVPSVVPSTSFALSYPHRRYGTLPLNTRTRSFFPQGSEGRSMATVVDGRWGKRYTTWVVHNGRYVSGLSEWMEEHNLPVGAQITLERTQTPGEVVIDYRPRRMKREWSRFATANQGSLGITFEMNKIQITCEYDDNLIVSAEDTEQLDDLSRRADKANMSLDEIVEQIVPELTKLSPQGTAHAKTIYSAVNMFWRCAPGPVFYALISNRRFRDSGGGFFALEV